MKTQSGKTKNTKKTTCYKKSVCRVLQKQHANLWKSSIHAGSERITFLKTVRTCHIQQRHFCRFLAHLLANARSLGLRRAEGDQSFFCGFTGGLGSFSSSFISGCIRFTSACLVTSFRRNWSRNARSCASSGLRTLASMAAPTMTFCAVSRLRLFAFRRCNLTSASAIYCSSVLLIS